MSAACKFGDILADPQIRPRWEKVRRYFFLRESTYDMTRRCNIHCDGCYYFEGEKHLAAENRDPAAWRELMAAEKARGITFAVLTRAKPSSVSKTGFLTLTITIALLFLSIPSAENSSTALVIPTFERSGF